ncbi:MAG TPA: polysaccharide deacetylase family protein [Candidatus Aquicultor sp.]|jgi:peptidoglycan/xylan/chitin deacetylase (PgdA/CDA1 family)
MVKDKNKQRNRRITIASVIITVLVLAVLVAAYIGPSGAISVKNVRTLIMGTTSPGGHKEQSKPNHAAKQETENIPTYEETPIVASENLDPIIEESSTIETTTITPPANTSKPDTQPGASSSTGAQSRSIPGYIPVLMYHCVNDKTNFINTTEYNLTVDTGSFMQELDWLQSRGFTIVSLNDAYSGLIEGKKLSPNPIVLTFDDGSADSYTVVYPILKQRGASGTFFVLPERVDRGRGLTWPQVIEMANNGMQIESHTMKHSDLVTLPLDKVTYELQQSKAEIEKKTGYPVNFLAYPFGDYNVQVMDAVRAAGYKAAFTTRQGLWLPSDFLLKLKRVRVSRGESIELFEAMLPASKHTAKPLTTPGNSSR